MIGERAPCHSRTTGPPTRIRSWRSTAWAASTGTWTPVCSTWTPSAHEIFDLRPDEYDGNPESLSPRVPADRRAAAWTPWSPRPSRTAARTTAPTSASAAATAPCAGPTPRATSAATRRAARAAIIGIVRDATEELRELAARTRAGRPRRGPPPADQRRPAHHGRPGPRPDRPGRHRRPQGHPRPHPPRRHQPGHGPGRGRPDPAGRRGPRGQLRARHPRHPHRRAVPDERGRTAPSSRASSSRRRSSPSRYPLLWPHITDLQDHLGRLSAADRRRPARSARWACSTATGTASPPEERNVLVALGSSIAQSLQRAMFYEQEKDLAEGLQQAMLPRSIPSVPGADIAVRYRAASFGGSLGRDIGGDWYDLIPLPGGRVGAVIGDVQGHDTHAAAVMGQLRIVLRAYAAEGHTPATVMARASVFLHELDTDRFATCPVRGGRPVHRRGPGGPGRPHRPAGAAHRRHLPPGDRGRGAAARAVRRVRRPRTTRWPPSSWTPGRPCCCAPTAWSSSPAPTSTTACGPSGRSSPPGPEDVDDLADRLIDVAEERGGDDDVALLLLRRRGPDAAAARRAAPAARRARRPGGAHRGPAHDRRGRPHLGRAGPVPTRSSWSPTS